MNETVFWAIIEQSKSDNDSTFSSKVVEKLSEFKKDDIYEFQVILNQKLSEIYTWDAFGSHVIFEAVTEDLAFQDFRHFIVSRGKDFFDRFSKEGAESVAEELLNFEENNVPMRFESFTYVCKNALRKMTKEQFIDPRDFAFEKGYPSLPSLKFKGIPVYEDDYPQHFPKLWKYREMLKEKYGF
jgi:Protein of unknown function (DUF4240)